MTENKFHYYVAYTYGMGGHGCYHAELNKPLETYQDVLGLAQIIREKRHAGSGDPVIIQNWIRLQ